MLKPEPLKRAWRRTVGKELGMYQTPSDAALVAFGAQVQAGVLLAFLSFARRRLGDHAARESVRAYARAAWDEALMLGGYDTRHQRPVAMCSRPIAGPDEEDGQGFLRAQLAERLGGDLERLRESKGLSRQALGQRIGVEERTILHWERGRRWPGPANFRALRRALT